MKLAKTITISAFFLCGMLVIHALILWRFREMIARGDPDFTTFYMAGKMARMGMGHELYDLKAEWRVQQEFAPGVSIRQAALPYMHPPLEALLFAPLTLLPYSHAFVVWDGFNLLILLGLPYLLRPHLPLLDLIPPAAIALIELAYFPVFFVLLQGQDAILLLLLYSLVFSDLKKNATGRAGFWLALGLFRFHLIAPFVFVMLLLKKFRLIATFTTTSAVLAGLSAWVVGWQGLLQYPRYIWWLEQHRSQAILTPSDTTTIRGLVDTILGKWVPAHIQLAAVLALSAGMLYFAIKSWRHAEPASERWDLAFSATLVATVLVSYHSFIYDLSTLLLPVAISVSVLLRRRLFPNRLRWAMIISLLALFCTPLYLFLWFRLGHPNLMAVFLIVWFASLLGAAAQVVSRETGLPNCA